MAPVALHLQRTVAPGAGSTHELAILGLRHSMNHHPSNNFSGDLGFLCTRKKLGFSLESKMDDGAWRSGVGRFCFGLGFHPGTPNHFILTDFSLFLSLSFFVYLFCLF